MQHEIFLLIPQVRITPWVLWAQPGVRRAAPPCRGSGGVPLLAFSSSLRPPHSWTCGPLLPLLSVPHLTAPVWRLGEGLLLGRTHGIRSGPLGTSSDLPNSKSSMSPTPPEEVPFTLSESVFASHRGQDMAAGEGALRCLPRKLGLRALGSRLQSSHHTSPDTRPDDNTLLPLPKCSFLPAPFLRKPSRLT